MEKAIYIDWLFLPTPSTSIKAIVPKIAAVPTEKIIDYEEYKESHKDRDLPDWLFGYNRGALHQQFAKHENELQILRVKLINIIGSSSCPTI